MTVSAHRPDASDAWSALAEPWRRCLALAWEAAGAGTIPVGAVVVDAHGEIVATGRNRVWDHTGPAGQVHRSLLAHAEVNALVALDPSRRFRDHVLYSSLEPCLLCVGASHRATVGLVRYAGAEPFRGAAPVRGLVTGDAARRVPFEGPLEGPFGRLGTGLAVAFYLSDGPRSDDLVEVYERELPTAVAVGRGLNREDALGLAASGVSLGEALPRLWPSLQVD